MTISPGRKLAIKLIMAERRVSYTVAKHIIESMPLPRRIKLTERAMKKLGDGET